MARARAIVVLASVLLCGCGERVPSLAERTVEDREAGFRLVLPPGWRMFDYEARSRGGSLLLIEARSLQGAEKTFLEGLPGTVVPQLEAWSLLFFSVVGKGTRRDATLGGEPALEVSFPVQVRSTDPPSRADFWAARHGDALYILRATYPPDALEKDSKDVRELVASWEFVERVPRPKTRRR